MFLAAPIAQKGSLTQYVGRILRVHDGKTTAEVHDYLDERTGILAAMLAKRAPGYTGLGFPDPRKIALTPSASTEPYKDDLTRGHPTITSEYHDDTEYELLTNFDPEPADREVAGRQDAVTAALASVRAEGLEPGDEDLALFATVAAGLSTDLRERMLWQGAEIC